MGSTSKFVKISIGWAVCVAAGIYGFYLSKESIINKRYKQMKQREQERILNAANNDVISK